MPLEKLDDLKSKSRFKLFVKKGGVTEAILLQWANKSVENSMAYKRFVEPNTYQSQDAAQVLKAIYADDQSAALRETTSLISMVKENWVPNDDCAFSLTTIHEIPKDFLGWLYPQDSMLHPLFDRFFFKLSKSGITTKLLQTFITGRSQKDCQHLLETSQINFSLVEILFWILIIGVILALITFLIEIFLYSNCSRKINEFLS